MGAKRKGTNQRSHNVHMSTAFGLNMYIRIIIIIIYMFPDKELNAGGLKQ